MKTVLLNRGSDMLKISLTAFSDRPGNFIFVAIPNERGRYVRTDRSVALVPCEICGSVIGEPCMGSTGYKGGTHAVRRELAQRRFFLRGIQQTEDVIQITME